MMFKHDLGHLRLDPGLAWEFEKSVQTHILRGRALHCNHSRVLYMVKKSIQDSLAICKIQNAKKFTDIMESAYIHFCLI